MVLSRRYGRGFAIRSAVVAAIPYAAQQLLVRRALVAAPAGEPGDLDVIDAITLSRGLSACVVAALAVTGPRDRRGLAGWIAWPSALIGSTLTDWIDGPLARRRARGPSRLGRVLDLELDSALTLATGIAAVRFGQAHPLCLLTPSLRYLAMASPIPYDDVFAVGKTDRARNLGITQMVLALASFAPFARERSVSVTRTASLMLVPIHMVALLMALPPGRRPI